MGTQAALDEQPFDGWRLAGDTDVHNDPLLDSIILLARLHGRPVSRNVVRAGLPLVNNALTVELFPRAARRAGLSSRVLRQAILAINELTLPAILLLEGRRACLLTAMDREAETLTVVFPETGMGEEKLPLAKIEEVYTGFAIFVQPEYKISEQNIDKQADGPGGWFWGVLFSSWRTYRDVLIASLLINIFGLATPFYILNVYDKVIANAAYETLWVLTSGILIIYFFELLLRGLRGYFVDEAGKRANLIISAALFERVLGLRMEVRPKSVGAFAKNLQRFDSIRDFITSFSIVTVVDLPFVFLGLFAIWYLAGVMVLVHIAGMVILVAYAAYVQVPLRQAVQRTFKASAQKNAILVEGLSGIETVKMHGAESQLQRAWEESVSFISRWGAKARFLSNSVNHVSGFIRNTTLVAVVVVGVYLVLNGDLTKGGLIACVILTRRVINPMSQVVNLATRYHQAKEALASLNRIMSKPVERPQGKTFLHRTRFRGEIEMKNVTFSYPGTTTPVLNNLSLKMNAGERVVLIGPIGSGKTTVGKLLLGLYEPTGGMVAMDGTDIRQIDPSELRHFIGCVPQDVNLFSGTIRDNIILGTYGVDDADILRAAELAGVTDFVKKNPLGFDMQVGEFGKGLSGGQRQSVAMARALLLDPPILLFDEPTSSMDNKTESGLKRRLAEIIQGKTCILITHRASMLDLVERVVVLDAGQIIADGPKESVMDDLKSGHLSF
ncbi:MAG TPA: type I secretion system permease/ATPase [Desulfobacteraceae bacterium]|nr:type I secretion system permease/ATPase [Desulfobacteraceae bacterium]